jgi:serine/alanine adding enzyme
MLYIPRGPIMDYSDKELVAFVISSLKKYGKTKRALFIKMDPALLLKQYKIGEEVDENKGTLLAIDNLKAAGCEWTGRTTTIAESIQPRFQANVYTQEDMTSTFPKHTKRLMKDAVHRGVIMVQHQAGISQFHIFIHFLIASVTVPASSRWVISLGW